jgi:hypothetical protein
VTHRKYRSNKNTYHEIRSVSDRLCKEFELSVIEPQATKTYGKSYDAYRPDQTSGSWRDKLKTAIDNLIPEANDFEHLLKLMEQQGYKIKRGKHISFCAEGQERYTRMKSIGEGYTEEEIKKRISEKPERKSVEPQHEGATETVYPTQTEKPETIKPLIDIAGNPIYAESRGLEQWARLQNLKNSAAAFNLMMNYGGMEAFMKLYNDCKTDVDTITNGIEANKEQIKAHGYLRKELVTYNRTKPIYKEYTEHKTKFFQDRFRKKHESDIIAHEFAEAELQSYPKPLPKIKDLDASVARYKTANVNNNTVLTKKKAELNQLKTIHNYLYHLKLTHEPPPPPREQTHTRKRSYDLDR